MAWPSLLIDRALAWRNSPSSSKASSSKKKRVVSPDVRKYSSLCRVCSLVVKMDFTPASGSNAVDQRLGSGLQRAARRLRHEAGQDEEPVPPVVRRRAGLSTGPT